MIRPKPDGYDKTVMVRNLIKLNTIHTTFSNNIIIHSSTHLQVSILKVTLYSDVAI